MKSFRRMTQADMLAEEGMQRAADHADDVDEGWTDKAYFFLVGYCRESTEFQSADVRSAAIAAGVPPPPDDRAWGAPFRRAKKAGLIRFARYAPNSAPGSHNRPSIVWQADQGKAAAFAGLVR